MGSFSWKWIISISERSSELLLECSLFRESFWGFLVFFPQFSFFLEEKNNSWQNISKSRKPSPIIIVYIWGGGGKVFSLLCSNSNCPGIILCKFYHCTLVHYRGIYFYHCKEIAVFPSRCYTNHRIALGQMQKKVWASHDKCGNC